MLFWCKCSCQKRWRLATKVYRQTSLTRLLNDLLISLIGKRPRLATARQLYCMAFMPYRSVDTGEWASYVGSSPCTKPLNSSCSPSPSTLIFTYQVSPWVQNRREFAPAACITQVRKRFEHNRAGQVLFDHQARNVAGSISLPPTVTSVG